MPAMRLVTSTLLLAFILSGVGCDGLLAKYIVASPNRGLSVEKLTRDEPELALPGSVIDHELRIEADGPAPQSLAVWVIDPSNERLVDGEAEPMPIFEKTDDRPRTTSPPRATIFLVHGYYDEINQTRYLMWARTLAAEGYRVVLTDMRGHGRSTGDWSTYGVAESRDLIQVADRLEAEGLLVEPLGVAAVSFGASTAVQWAEMDERIDAMALISTFTTMRDVVPDFGRAIGFDMFSDEKYQHIISMAGDYAGFDPDDADVISRIGKLDVPVLLFHGEDDDLIPIRHAVRLYEAADSETVELIRVAGADHTSLGDAVSEPIRQPMLDWFERYLFAEPVADQRRTEQRSHAER